MFDICGMLDIFDMPDISGVLHMSRVLDIDVIEISGILDISACPV